jgi:acetyltransferase-like isoleucine patch superfamily enzyme
MGVLQTFISKTLIHLARTWDRRRPAIEKTYSIGKSKVRIGAYTYGFENLEIREWGEGADLTIGRFCSIADGVQVFLGGNHRIDWVSTFPFQPDFVPAKRFVISGHPSTKGSVAIGNDVWIGSGATILSGLTIGDGAVVAANSTVTKSIAPYEIWGGNPAKLIKLRFDSVIVERLLTLSWWNLPPDEIKQFVHVLTAPPDVDALNLLIEMHSAKKT